jgi:hypothetical protein
MSAVNRRAGSVDMPALAPIENMSSEHATQGRADYTSTTTASRVTRADFGSHAFASDRLPTLPGVRTQIA